MASKISKPDDVKSWPGRRIDMAEYGRALAKYRADYEARTGRPLEIPRNSGKRRTASKNADVR